MSSRPRPVPAGGANVARARSRLPVLAGLAIMVVAPAACDPGETVPSAESIPVEAPDHRGDTGLFEDSARVEVLRLQATRDVPGLIERLGDSDAGVRSRAALALASARDSAAVGSLLTVVTTDPDPDVRREAAFALGQLPVPDGAGALMDALNSEDDPAVRTALIESLGLRGGPPALDALLGLEPAPDAASAHALALSRHGLRAELEPAPRLLDRLVELLGHDDPAVREGAAYYFGRLVDPAPWSDRADDVRGVLDGLDRDDPAALSLVLGIGRLRDRDDAERLIGWMGEAEDWRIRVNAVRAVGTTQLLETEGVREALWERVESDPYDHVAIEAANSLLSGFRVPLSVRSRAEQWVATGPERWRAKVPFLVHRGMMGEGDEIVAWLEEYSDESAELARVAPLLLAQAEHVPALRAVPAYLDHEDVHVRTAAMGVLAQRWEFGNPDSEMQQEYFDRFEEALFEEHPWVAAKAAEGLSTPTFHPFGSVPVLQEGWERRIAGDRDEELPVLVAILDALATVGDPAAEPLIEGALEDPDFRIRRAAGEAWESLTGQEVRGLAIPEPGIELDPEYLAGLGPEPVLALDTEFGTIRVRLVPDRAPLTVQAVAQWAEEGRYDGTLFHRVIANFVTQGGDFTGGDGSGSPGVTLRTEINGIPFRRGVIGMASLGHDTEGSQFFLAHSPQPHLDGSVGAQGGAQGEWQAYTSFGWVVEGESALDRLMEGDRIIEARIERGTGGTD